jgi:hypothetical protein
MKSHEDKSEDSRPPDRSYVSIKAALSRANGLTLVSHIQDILSRITIILIFVWSLDGDGKSAGLGVARIWSLALIIFGAIWMLSKLKLSGLINQIENNFVVQALADEDARQATKWEHLLIVIGTRTSATRASMMLRWFLDYEPVWLTALLVTLGWIHTIAPLG